MGCLPGAPGAHLRGLRRPSSSSSVCIQCGGEPTSHFIAQKEGRFYRSFLKPEAHSFRSFKRRVMVCSVIGEVGTVCTHRGTRGPSSAPPLRWDFPTEDLFSASDAPPVTWPGLRCLCTFTDDPRAGLFPDSPWKEIELRPTATDGLKHGQHQSHVLSASHVQSVASPTFLPPHLALTVPSGAGMLILPDLQAGTLGPRDAKSSPEASRPRCGPPDL